MSGHAEAQVSKEAKAELDQAWNRWMEARGKAGKPRLGFGSMDRVIDAYLEYARLMHKYVDSNWS